MTCMGSQPPTHQGYMTHLTRQGKKQLYALAFWYLLIGTKWLHKKQLQIQFSQKPFSLLTGCTACIYLSLPQRDGTGKKPLFQRHCWIKATNESSWITDSYYLVGWRHKKSTAQIHWCNPMFPTDIVVMAWWRCWCSNMILLFVLLYLLF